MRQLPVRPQAMDVMFGLFAVLLIITCAMLR
jgi:hypothetical protein